MPTVPAPLYEKILHDPAHRDPRGFIIPANQADDANAVEFINALLKTGSGRDEGDFFVHCRR